MTPQEVLRNRFQRVAQRYGQVIGAPPSMSCDVAQMQSDIRMMVDALNNYTVPQAGPPATVSAVELLIHVEGGGAQAYLNAELQDADGHRAGSKMIPLTEVSLDATVRTIIDAAVEIGKLPKAQ